MIDADVARAQAGDKAALDRVLRVQYDRMYAVCRRLTGNDADAADACQEALIAVVRNIAKFDGRSGFGTWTYRIAVNASLDELRRRRRRARPDNRIIEAHSDDADPTPDASVSISDRLALDAALAALSPDFRAAVVLRDVAGLDYAEIAEALDIPAGTVRSRIAHAAAPRWPPPCAAPTREPAATVATSKDSQPSMPPMTHPDDELLSALLDGEAAPGDVAHVEDCAECQARLAELRFVVGAIAASVPVPPGHLREASVAVALRTGEQPTRRTLPDLRRYNGLSAAAVLVVALAVGGLLIAQLGRSDRPSRDELASGGAAGLSTSAGDATLKSSAPESAAMAAPSAQDSLASGGTAGPYDAGDLGSLSGIDAVIQRASNDLERSARSDAAPRTTQESPCPYETAGTALWQATLTYEGQAAVAHAIETDDAGRVMQILRRSDCAVLLTQGF